MRFTLSTLVDFFHFRRPYGTNTSSTNSPKRQISFCSRLAFSSAISLVSSCLAWDLDISLTKPTTLLLRRPLCHHWATQRPFCFLIPLCEYRLRISFLLCAFPDTPIWRCGYRSTWGGLFVGLDPGKEHLAPDQFFLPSDT